MAEKKAEEALWNIMEQEAPSLGAFLLEQRQKRGLTLQDLAEKTRVKTEFLDAIEKEQWNRLPPPPYVKGFLKAYGRALGIEPEGLVDSYQRLDSRVAALKPISKKARSARVFYLLGIPLIIALLAVIYFLGDSLLHIPMDSMRSLFSSGHGPVEVKVGKEGIQPALQEDRTVQDKVGHLSPPAQIAQERLEDSTSESIEETQLSSQATLEGKLLLKAKAHKRTWIRVTADRKDTVEFMLAAGSEREFRANEVFELLIGNAGGITLEFNGEKLDNLGAPGEVLRLRLPDETMKKGENR